MDLFGGYVEDVLKSRNRLKAIDDWAPGHPSNFVFTLGSSASPAVKLLKTSSRDKHGVLMYPKSGFVMGEVGDGYDLCVHSGYFQCSPGIYTTIAPGYPAVPVDDKLLAGSQYWEPEVIEVWMCL